MLVSIYLPTRNRVDLLQKAVDSALAQTYRDIELIVVNDASTDGTEEYLRRKAQIDSRLIHLSNSKPQGAPTSRNLAISRSSGAFVTGLDDDDEFHPERIGAFVEYWTLLTSRGTTPACLYSQDIWLNNGVQYRTTQKRSFIEAKELFEYNYIGNQIFAPREHFITVGLFDEQLPAWQDLELLIRLLRQFGRAHLLDMPTYLFDMTLRPDRISSQERKIRAAFEIVAKKHSEKDAAKQLTLFLQMFQHGYNISPSLGDWLKFFRFRKFPKGLLRMINSTIANGSSDLTPKS
jgi:glycosyltransferase involved in cell wall biosynthesis